MNLNKIFLKYEKRIAMLSGQRCNIYRPNYSAIDNALGSPIYSNVKVKMEVTSPRFAMWSFTNNILYTIFCDRKLIQPGDVIVPIEGHSTPPVTVLNMSPLEECVGFSSAREARISLTVLTADDIYRHVRFEFVPSTAFPGSGLREAMENQFLVPSKKVVLFSRDNLKSSEVDWEVQGVRFIETDGETETRYIIKLVESIGNLVQLTLSQER